MDLSKPISYRGHSINNVILQTGRVLQGVQLETADYSGVEGVGYTEKRAGADGIHASDVYLGARYLDLTGFVYGLSLADMFDRLHVLRSTFSPTGAYAESPGDRGFLPLMFFQPTLDTASFPVLTYPNGIPMMINCRPVANLRFTIIRDRLTDDPSRPSSTSWAARLIAKDPRVYVSNVDGSSSPSQIVFINGAVNTPNGTAGTAVNRGDYETPLNIQLVVNTPPATDQTFRLKGLNDVDMVITIKAKTPGNAVMPKTVYRWFGDDRVLMTEDITAGVGTQPPVLRMDLVKFNTKQRRPMVPAKVDAPTKPFNSAYTIYRSYALDTDSRLFWSEAFA